MREEIRLKSKDKPISVFYFLFSVFKIIKECIKENRYNIYKTFSKGNGIFGKILDSVVMLCIDSWTLRWELTFCFGSILAVISAYNYKYVIKQSSKEVIKPTLNLFIWFIKIPIGLNVCYLGFYIRDDLLNLTFLCLAIYIMVNILKTTSNVSGSRKLLLAKYSAPIRNMCLLVIAFVQTFKGSQKTLDSVVDNNFYNTVIDTQLFPVVLLLILVLCLTYTKHVYSGLKMEFFDI